MTALDAQYPPAEPARFVWTRRALEAWFDGRTDPRHTISAPNIADVYDGYVRQLAKGTPWALVRGCQIAATGAAGYPVHYADRIVCDA